MSDVPPEGGLFSAILGNPTLRTIFVWGVAVNVLGRTLDPFLTQLAQVANAAHPERVLEPAELADMVLRGWMTHAEALSDAEGSGINAERFAKMVDNVGEPPGLMELLEMFRRGFIPWDADQGEPSVVYGIKTSRVRNEWIEPLRHLQFTVPSVGDVVDALVEEQTDRATAEELVAKAGMDPQYLDLLFHTRGRPPGPEQLAEMAHRGIIPWTGTGAGVLSHQQGIAESAVKTKWTDALARVSEYLPPPRTVTAMLREGAFNADQAHQLFADAGLSPDMAAAYVAAATHQKLHPDKQLAKSEVETLYVDQAISAEEAGSMLAALGYDPHEVAFLLELADLKRVRRFVESAVTHVRTLFLARKIDAPNAAQSLADIGVAEGQRSQLMTLWAMERRATVRVLSPAQVVDAFAEAVIDQATAQQELVALGYSEFDAWVLLSTKNKGALPDRPEPGPFPSGNIT